MKEITYGPDGKPVPPSPDVIQAARAAGLVQVQILCEDPGSDSSDPTGKSFWAFVPCVPRIGEELWLENMEPLTVKNVVHNFLAADAAGLVTALPIVIAMKNAHPQAEPHENEVNS